MRFGPEELADIGERLLAARGEKGFKQAEVALALGINQTLLCNIEKGRSRAGLITNLNKLCQFYGVTQSWVTGMNEELFLLKKPVDDQLARIERKLDLLIKHFGLEEQLNTRG